LDRAIWVEISQYALMPPADPLEFRGIFNEDSELYEAVRPGYSDELVDDLVERGRVSPRDLILEIGCGTGQLTVPLARRGFRIVCVELGAKLAAVARRNLAEFPEVIVETAAFEAWDPAGRSFDMVVAATAWHWLDPDVRYIKAAAVLDNGGWLVIITTQHVLPEGGDLFFREIQDVYEAIGEGDGSGGPPLPEDVADLRQEIAASGLFAIVEVRRYVWERVYTADQSLAFLDTYSGHRAMEPAKREQLYREIRRRLADRPDRRVTKHYLNLLHVARRRPSA
jgi:SAM-dependent methyltransferase